MQIESSPNQKVEELRQALYTHVQKAKTEKKKKRGREAFFFLFFIPFLCLLLFILSIENKIKVFSSATHSPHHQNTYL